MGVFNIAYTKYIYIYNIYACLHKEVVVMRIIAVVMIV